MEKRYYYVCNVFEDTVKSARNVTTDSPAASGKVSRICNAVRKAGGNVSIISLGRGSCKGTWKKYSATVRRTGKVPIIYLDFWDMPVITHVVSALSLLFLLLRLTNADSVLIFYNCQIHNVLALAMMRLLGRRCILDLEDGYRNDEKAASRLLNTLLLKIHNVCCSSGAMLASTSLKGQSTARRTYVCYGVADPCSMEKGWTGITLQVLLGGSLLLDTGAALFLDALELLRAERPDILRRLNFVVTGFGDFAEKLRSAAMGQMKDFLDFRGNVSSKEYRDIMLQSHVGLCLKLPSSSMGATTFPSKVVELASYGLLVVSTRVSDVPVVFDKDTAFLLDEATPVALANALANIAQEPGSACETALAGQRRIENLLSAERVGSDLLRFWNGDFFGHNHEQ